MSEIKTVPYRPEHFRFLQNISTYYASLASHYGLDEQAMAALYLRGPAYTMFADDEMIGCGGIIRLWPGVGDAWVLTTPLINKYPKAVTKAVKFYLNEAIHNLRLVRVQCVVQKEFWVGHRWIKVLGFQEEGLMRKFFGGMDFVRYALITEFKE